MREILTQAVLTRAAITDLDYFNAVGMDLKERLEDNQSFRSLYCVLT